MLIPRDVQSDSIVALSPCGKEFCNTFEGKADIALMMEATGEGSAAI